MGRREMARDHQPPEPRVEPNELFRVQQQGWYDPATLVAQPTLKEVPPAGPKLSDIIEGKQVRK